MGSDQIDSNVPRRGFKTSWAERSEVDGHSASAMREIAPGVPPTSAAVDLSILIVADNASENYGGEAVLPLRYFEALRSRGVPTRLITHSRVRPELSSRMPEALEHIYFIKDSWLHRALWRLGRPLGDRLRDVTTGFLSRLITQRAQVRLAKTLVDRHGINVVHQPTPVSPREPSLLKGLGASVVFGPMNGGTTFPPAFRNQEWRFTRGILIVLRALAPVLQRVISGKRQAAVLLVANARTRLMLFPAKHAEVFTLSENGVDLKVWQPRNGAPRLGPECRFVFVGRLVRTKGVHLWLDAFRQAVDQRSVMAGMVIGDGCERGALMNQARAAGILADSPNQPGKVFFAGRKEQADVVDLLADQDCLVLPTLRECGGAVLLEAMAMELPVIATDWDGPADYVDSSCGVLVRPDGKESLVTGFAKAMRRIASDPELRARMGNAGRRKVEYLYSWDGKIDSMIDFYRSAVANYDTESKYTRW